MKPNDTVIFIEDEHPRDRAQRLGKPWRNRRPGRPINKVGHLDTVDKVTGKKAKFKKDKQADFDKDDGRELPDSRIKRERDGEPARRAYICPPNAFPLPRGLQATIESIELDDETIEAIKRYDSAVRASRGDRRADRRGE
jgi:hypothetical protein